MKIKCISLLLIAFLVNGLTVSAQSWLWGTEGTIPLHNKYSNGEGWAVSADHAGNSYVTGWFQDTIIIGSYYLVSNYFTESMFIAKYDSNGNVLWVEQSQCYNPASSFSDATTITTDMSGNVYVAGYFADTVSFEPFNLQVQTENVGLFLVKYNNNGNIVWAKQSVPSTYGGGFCNWVTTDRSGNVYTTGYFNDTISFGSNTLIAKNGYSIFYAKYDSNGNVLWAKQPGLPSNYIFDHSNSIIIDKFNNVYVTGGFEDTLTFGTTVLISKSENFPTDVFLAKFDSNGNNLWAKQSLCNEPNSRLSIEGTGVTINKNGSLYLTGTFNDTTAFGSNILIANNYQDIFLAEYDLNGNIKWIKSSNVLKNAVWESYEIVTDTINNVYIVGGDNSYGSGSSGDEIVFGTDTISIGSVSKDGNSILVKFDTSGNVICSVGVNGGGDDNNGIAVAPSGKYVYFGGDLWTAIRFGTDSLPFENTELPFMAKWQPCFECDSVVTIIPQSPLVCSGQSISLKAMGGANYTWNPATTLNSSTGDSVVANPTVTTVYSVTGTGTTGCTSIALDSVKVNPIPLVNIKPLLPSFCYGDSIILTANGGANYIWSPVSGLNTTFGSSVIANPTNTTTYTISASLNGCSNSGQVIVTVNLLPIVSSTPTSSILCYGQSDTLLATGGGNYSWSPATGLNISIGSSVIATPTNNVTYTVSVTDSAGCSGYASDTITLLYGPNQPTITQNEDVLSFSATQGNQWIRNDSVLQGATDQDYTATVAGWYKVIAENPANGCSTSSDSIYVSTLTSINQLTGYRGQLSIYPNPTTNDIIINIGSSVTDLSNWKLQVIDEIGRVLYSMPSLNYTNEIDLSNLPAASYFIAVTNNAGRTVVPVVKVN